MSCVLPAILLALSLPTVTANAVVPIPPAATILERSVDANQRDWKAAPRYDYEERDRDADGHTRTYEELMVLGSPYERLIGVDGNPIPTAQREAEEKKLQKAIAERDAETPAERARRLAEYETGRKQDHLLMNQLARAFQFQITGEERLGTRLVYVLKATPRPGYQPPNMDTKVLTGMEGTLWIDAATYQWVKVEARVIHPVTIAGFLARVEPGTQFVLEKAPVAEGIWLPSHFTVQSKARVLFFFTHRTQKDETYFDYQLSRTDPALAPLLSGSR
ncbi:MAG TPA: hypothetical protein VMV61_07805 [Patescibacteria group bacterium]|nr:hypothetical protein [Patescibacteria group bacterium]